MTTDTEIICPGCGLTEVARLVFGYPGREFRELYEGQDVAFGGCMAWGDARDPQSACRACGLWFGELVQLPVPRMFTGGEPEWEPPDHAETSPDRLAVLSFRRGRR